MSWCFGGNHYNLEINYDLFITTETSIATHPYVAVDIAFILMEGISTICVEETVIRQLYDVTACLITTYLIINIGVVSLIKRDIGAF